MAMNRILTTRFGTYRLGQYEKKTGKGIMDILDIGNFEVNKLAEIIKLGSPEISMDDDEKAYAKLDAYLASSDDNSIITAYLDIIDEINRDLKMFTGVNMGVLKERMRNEMAALAKKIENVAVENTNNKVVDITNSIPSDKSESTDL